MATVYSSSSALSNAKRLAPLCSSPRRLCLGPGGMGTREDLTPVGSVISDTAQHAPCPDLSGLPHARGHNSTTCSALHIRTQGLSRCAGVGDCRGVVLDSV